MAGVILENMSTKKILIFCALLAILQAVCFFIGAIWAPEPTSAMKHVATKCIDPTENYKKLMQPRGTEACPKIRDFEEAISKQIEANFIVFSVRIPHPPHQMLRRFQFMVGVLEVEILQHDDRPLDETDALLDMVITFAYSDNDEGDSDYHIITQVNESRRLECEYRKISDGQKYDCSPLSLFELSSVHHKHYLMNIRLPVKYDPATGRETNANIGYLQDLSIIEIHQTGGFTIIYLTMKSVLFPLVLGMMIFFWRRITFLSRPPLLLERTILALAVTVTFLNFPLEWLTFFFEIPVMLLISDIRQGATYAMLFSFWIIFVGEHLMDTSPRNQLKGYWQQITAILFACGCLLLFDIGERGAQLVNPFYTVWNTPQGAKLAMAFIIMAAVCVCIYFLFLCFMVFCVFRNMRLKRSALLSMTKARQVHYKGLFYRFRFFMLFTLLCAILTVVFFIMSQMNEGQWRLEGEARLRYTSGFFTGVYGMWNIYVLAVLFLYSPSHKKMPSTEGGDTSEDSKVEFEMSTSTSAIPGPSGVVSQAAAAPSEMYQLLGKAATD